MNCGGPSGVEELRARLKIVEALPVDDKLLEGYGQALGVDARSGRESRWATRTAVAALGKCGY